MTLPHNLPPGNTVIMIRGDTYDALLRGLLLCIENQKAITVLLQDIEDQLSAQGQQEPTYTEHRTLGRVQK